MEEENFTPPSDAILVDKKKSGFTPPTDAILKKKEESKSTYQKNLLELVSKPKKQNTLSGTDPQKKVSESGSLNGNVKKTHKFGNVVVSKKVNSEMKQLKGKLSNDDLSMMKKTDTYSPKEVTNKQEDRDFGDYISDNIDVGIAKTSKAVYDTPSLVYDAVASYITNPIIEAGYELTGNGKDFVPASSKNVAKLLGFENIPSKLLKEKIDRLNKKLEEQTKSYGGDPLSAIEAGRYGDAAKIVIGSTMQSLPAIVVSVGTGGGSAGLASIGVLTASEKNAELEEKNPEVSATARVSNSLASGAIEATFGHIFTGATGAVVGKILRAEGANGAITLKNSFVSVAEKYIMKNPMVGFVGAVLEEGGVDYSEQMNDIATGIRKEIDVKQIYNSSISSLGFATPGTVSVYGAKAYMSSKKYAKVKSVNKQIYNLTSEINKDGTSEASKKILSIKVDQLIQGNKKFLGEHLERLKHLSAEDKVLLNQTNKVVDEVKSSIETLKENVDLSPEALKIAKEELYKDYVEAVKKRREIFSKVKEVEVSGDFSDFEGVPVDFDIETSGVSSLPINDQNRLNKEALASLNQELNPTGKEQVDITKDMVSKRASELYSKEVESTNNVKEEVATAKESTDNDVKVEELRSKEQTELKEALPDAEVNAEGKVDAEKLSTEDKVVFDGIYNKYDKLISPLLKTTNTESTINEETTTKDQVVDNSTQKLTEDDLPGYERMMSETDGIVEKSKKRRVSMSKIADNVMSYVTGSKVYEDATDVQREALVRDVRSRFGFKEKAAPSVNKILGNIKDVKKITINEKTALKKQILDKAKAAKDAVMAQKNIAQQLAKDVKEMAVAGVITAKQAANVVTAFSKTNVFNEASVDKFTTYATKVFENAEYQDKIDTANDLASSIKTKLKSKDIDQELKDLAKKFVSINFDNVLDADTYFELGNNINKNILGSTTRGSKLNVAEGIDKAKLSKYIKAELDNQDSIAIQDRMNKFQDNTGLDPSEFNYDEIEAILNDEKEIKDTSYSQPEVKAKLKKAYNSLKSIVQDVIKNKKDRFTGESIDISKETIDSVKELSDIDFSLLSNKDALKVIDVLNDIAVNGYSNKVDSFLADYRGIKNSFEFAQGDSARPMKLFFSRWAGKLWNKQIGSLYSITEKMFDGFEQGNNFMRSMGFDKIQRGTVKSEMKVNKSMSDYSNSFINTKPNGQAFNTEYNKAERTFLAMATRFTPGKEVEDFERNKSLIEQSINVLSKGSDSERKSAKIQKEVYDKIFKDSSSKEDVISKADKINVNAKEQMSSYHKENFKSNADAALKYYNTVLIEDENYNTVKYSRLSGEKAVIDADGFDSAIVNKEGKVYDKKAGVFNELSNPKKIKEGFYIDTNFEANNEQAMKSALIDANTADAVREMKAFIYSDAFSIIIPDSSDRNLFIERLKNFVDIKRGRNYPPINKEEIAFLNKATKTISRIGSVKALGGITQLPKQTISVGVSTLINSGRISIVDAFDPKWNDFINNSGYEIATRGIHSSSDFSQIEDILKSVENSKPKEIMSKLENAQGVYLKWFLAKPDVFIAKASWISYYKEGLKKQGIDPDGMDIASHTINEDAAFYAQRQTDRQQNVSDTALEGKWLTSKDPVAELSRSIFLPFAKFSLNQKSRMYSDATIAFNKNASVEDRKLALKSLIALSAEQAVFRTISASISVGIYSGVASLMGYEESEEDKDKRIRKVIESQLKSSVADYGSPFPFLDYPTQYAFGKTLDFIQDEAGVSKDDKYNLVPYLSKDYADRFGMYGIVAKGGADFIEFQKMAWEGTYNERGEEKEIPIDTQNALRVASAGNLLYHMGFLPSEFNLAFKDMQKIAKKGDLNNSDAPIKKRKSLFSGSSLFRNKKSLFK